MAALRLVALALVFGMPGAPAVAGPAPAAPDAAAAIPPAVARWNPLIREASRRFGVPEAWIAAVMRAESGGRTRLDGRPIVSRAGAMGLMQVMPGTYAAMRRRHGLGLDPHDPRDNIMAGTAYLKLMHDRFGYPGLFAAYNAGPGRYAEHLATGRPLPGETRAYMAQLARAPSTREMPLAVLSSESLFFALARPAASTSAPPEATASDSLFAVRRPLGDHP